MKTHESEESRYIDDGTSDTLRELHVPPAVEAGLEARGRQQQIEAVLNTLPDTVRVSLVMCEMDELSS